jgi:hypothetical protein
MVQAEFVSCSVFWHAYLSSQGESGAFALALLVLIPNGLLGVYLFYSFCSDRQHEKEMEQRARLLWHTLVPAFVRLSKCSIDGTNMAEDILRKNSLLNTAAEGAVAEEAALRRGNALERRKSVRSKSLSHKSRLELQRPMPPAPSSPSLDSVIVDC